MGGREGESPHGFLRFDHIENSRRVHVLVHEHNEVAIHEVPLTVSCQDLVADPQVPDTLLTSVLEGDEGRARETAAGFSCNRVFCKQNTDTFNSAKIRAR